MKRKVTRIVLAIFVLSIALTFSQVTTSAQTGGNYDLTWSAVESGGGMFSTGGTYSLGGTIGQADAGAMSGSSYLLAGGFWTGGVGAFTNLYLPIILK
jgi:hypothetical protein